MWQLMMKFKTGAWEIADHIDDSATNISERKQTLLNEFKSAFGQAYLFKWEHN